MNELKIYAINKFNKAENTRLRNKQQYEAERIAQIKTLVWESAEEELMEFLTFEEFYDIDVTFGKEYKSMGDHHMYFTFHPYKAMPIKVHTTNGKIDALTGGHRFEVADLFNNSTLIKGFDNFVIALGCAYNLWDSMERVIEMK